MKKIIPFIILIFTHSLFATECLQTNAAFDIGSGTTKMKVAMVDICKHKIIKILHESHRSVGYKQALKESKKNILDKKILTLGVEKLNEIKKEASSFKPKSFIAVATSAFRTASNGAQAALELTKKTGIDVNVISQIKEAEIGYIGAIDFSQDKIKTILVWDIGGGSMQISQSDDLKKFLVYEGKLAAVSFKNYIIEKIQEKKISKTISPNPMSLNEKNKAILYAREFARNTIPKDLQSKLKDKKSTLIGIGGVHYFSIASKVNTEEFYTIGMLRKKIQESLNKSDHELGGGEYISTDLSNLVLVAGFMEEFGINEVRTRKVNMATGLLKLPSILKN